MPHEKGIYMPTIGPRDLLLLLIGLEDQTGQQGFGGITRIQKLLYLLEVEEKIRAGVKGYEFAAYKAGPYSARIYDDLELLENLDYIRRAGSKEIATVEIDTDDMMRELEFSAEASDPEKAEVDLTFDQLMGPEDILAPERDEVRPTADSYEETRYYLTEEGKKKVEELLAKTEYEPFVDAIRKVKSRFAKYSLNDLLYYVYTRHPEMTTESEIKEKVLRRRPT